ncbi:MAG: o-succinylbenzoate synthase [Sphingobacteriia bacterium]|nr:o-succinylbenzoate synthase [Sphingobacteriia bacterium]NCC40934.1 o-succinylbenzoate synthase [Gammaproteobacteria bacterium]
MSMQIENDPLLRIDGLWFQPYCLPLRSVWSSSRGTFTERHGWLVTLKSGDLYGIGDCAPMPEAGTEKHQTASLTLAHLACSSQGLLASDLLNEFNLWLTKAPATRFAIECAAFDLISKARLLPLRHLLNENAGDRVPVNCIAGSLTHVTSREIEEHCLSGFNVIKLKVGIASITKELEHITRLANVLPNGTKFRLDANGAWTPAEAEWMIERLSGLPVECLEEPLAAPDPYHLSQLQSIADFPLALDENATRLLSNHGLADLGIKRLVIKPAVLGGLTRAIELADQATQTQIGVAITSVLESAAGLWATTQLAAAINNQIPHGLGTGSWILSDLGKSPEIMEGFIKLTNRPGSGLQIKNPHG